jgi:hypothetical protein
VNISQEKVENTEKVEKFEEGENEKEKLSYEENRKI